MWYFTWILGVCLAVAVGVLNGIWYEFHTTDDPDAEDPYPRIGEESELKP